MPDMLSVACPHCEHPLTVNVKFIGRDWPCPNCGETFEIPPFEVEPIEPPFEASLTTAENVGLEIVSETNIAAAQDSASDSLVSIQTDSETSDEPGDKEDGETEIRSMLDHLPMAAVTAGPANKSDILRSFLAIKWQEMARRNFFASVPTFVSKIEELAPLLSPGLARQLPKRLDDVRKRYEDAQPRIAKGMRVFASQQGLPQLAGVSIAAATEFFSSGDYAFVYPLAEMAVAALRLADVRNSGDELLRAFRLRTVSELFRKNTIPFDAVFGDVRQEAQTLRLITRGKNVAPHPDDLNRVLCNIVYEYYTTLLRQAVATSDRSRAQEIVPASLCYVSRLLAEEGDWKRLKEWVSLCSTVDSDAVDGAREMGLMIEADPVDAPTKGTQTDVMYCLQNRDIGGAIQALEPWFISVYDKLQNILKPFMVYRTPENNHLEIGGKSDPRYDLQRAIEQYHKGDFNTANARFGALPTIGAVGTHPLVREWRALVQARLGARQQAQTLFGLALKGGFVLEDTIWNLAVLLESEGSNASRRAAFEALRDYLKIDSIRVYDGGAESTETEKSGLHIVTNTATTLTLIGLALAVHQEQFIIDFVLNTPRNQLRLYDRLVPIAFILAYRHKHPQIDHLRDTLIGQWSGGGHVQWADPEKPVPEAEIRSYITDTRGDPIQLQRLAEYLELRKQHQKNSLVLHQYLADIYQTLEQPDKELGERISIVLKLSRFSVPLRELQDAFDVAIQTADENKLRDKLGPLLNWATRAGKKHWLEKWDFLKEKRPEKVPPPGSGISPPAPPISDLPLPPSPLARVPLADALRSAQVDAEVAVEIVSAGLVNDADDADLVIRIMNMRPAPLTDLELYLEFDSVGVHAGSMHAPIVGPHALKERSPMSVSYETIPIYCPPEVAATTVTAALVYTVDGQKRYREAARPRLTGRAFAALTGRSEGIPNDLYWYGGMVSGAYAHTFKGREKLRETLLDRTASGNMTHFLDGIKRVGKSSVCANLVYEPPDAIVAVHLDLERYALGDELTTTVRFCQHLLDDISRAVSERGCTLPSPIPRERWEAEPATIIFLEALRAISMAIAPARLLLMFDEVQSLLASVENNQRTKDPGKYVRKDFLDMLSAMLNDANRPAQLLFTASERFETVKSGGYYNLFNRLSPINLSFLDAAATSDILAAGIRDTGIRYVPETTSTVWQYLRGYPAHVQQMGDKLMEKLRQRHRTVVLPQDVSEVADAMIGDSILFDYQCNRDTIRRDEATLLEAIFKGQEQIYGKRSGIGRGVPVRTIVNYAPGLESARIPVVIKSLKNQQVIAEERDSDGQLIVRINGLLIEMWLSRLRDERGVLREEAFPSKRPSILTTAQASPVPSPDRTGCAVWIDFENVVRSNSLQSRFLGNVDSKRAAEDFVNRLLKACVHNGYDLRDKRVVAPWGIDELQPYQDAFEILGFKPINCLKGVKNAADFVIAQELTERLPLYSVSGIGTLLLITADNDLATTMTRSKGAGLKTVAWGTWDGRPSRDIKATADTANSLMEMMYRTG